MFLFQEKKERLVDEVRRHFGFKLDPRDERFQEMLAKREKEQKKLEKMARKEAREKQMIAKLQQKNVQIGEKWFSFNIVNIFFSVIKLFSQSYSCFSSESGSLNNNSSRYDFESIPHKDPFLSECADPCSWLMGPSIVRSSQL